MAARVADSRSHFELPFPVQVKWAKVPDDEEGPSGGEAGGRHMDPLTKDTFTNASKLVVLKNSGDVLLKETYVKLVKPDGVYDGEPGLQLCSYIYVHLIAGACTPSHSHSHTHTHVHSSMIHLHTRVFLLSPSLQARRSRRAMS